MKLEKKNCSMNITSDIARTNHPKPFFSLAPSIFLFKKLPIIIPSVAIKMIMIKKFQSMTVCVISPANPTIDLIEMINIEEAIAFFMGNFPRITSAGIIKKPPPAPTIPVSMPSPNPTIMSVNP